MEVSDDIKNGSLEDLEAMVDEMVEELLEMVDDPDLVVDKVAMLCNLSVISGWIRGLQSNT